MATSKELKANRQSLISSKNILAKRISQLKKIRDAIDSDMDSKIQKVNSAISSTKSDFIGGLKRETDKSLIESELQNFVQKGAAFDSEMSKVWSNILDEIARCNREISLLNTKIDNTDQAIRIAQENEAKAAEAE